MSERCFTSCLLAMLLALVFSGNTANPSTPFMAGMQGYNCTDLLSEQEIDEIVGLSGTKLNRSVRGDENDVLPGHTECGYELPENMLLTVAVYSGEGSGEGLETFDVVWTLAQSQGAEALSELGDSALLQTDFPSGPRVLARAKGLGIIVGAGDPEGLDKHDLDEVIKRVPTLVIERL